MDEEIIAINHVRMKLEERSTLLSECIQVLKDIAEMNPTALNFIEAHKSDVDDFERQWNAERGSSVLHQKSGSAR